MIDVKTAPNFLSLWWMLGLINGWESWSWIQTLGNYTKHCNNLNSNNNKSVPTLHPHPCECCLWLPQFQLCVLPKVARSFWCGWCSSPITSFSCTCVCLWGWGGVGRQRCNTLFTSLLISMTTGLNILLTYECFLCIVCVCALTPIPQHTGHKGKKEGQPPSHVVTGRMQGHSLHQMQRNWASVSQWTSILLLSQSPWILKREGEHSHTALHTLTYTTAHHQSESQSQPLTLSSYYR